MRAAHCLLFLILFTLAACSSKPSLPQSDAAQAVVNSISKKAKQYFEIYAERENIDDLMHFYAEEAVFEDIVFGQRAEGKSAIKQLLDWGNPNFTNDLPQVLVVEEQIVSNNQVITKGRFTPFTYYGQALGPWRFVMWHIYDENGQIVYQQDWINYTPKEQFLEGLNLN